MILFLVKPNQIAKLDKWYTIAQQVVLVITGYNAFCKMSKLLSRTLNLTNASIFLNGKVYFFSLKVANSLKMSM